MKSRKVKKQKDDFKLSPFALKLIKKLHDVLIKEVTNYDRKISNKKK